MIPTKLSDWSLELIEHIVTTKRFETEFFDFKEKLPDRRDIMAKERLRKTCVAFANSDGGFIVFGVSDKKETELFDRLVGLNASMDFPEHFGNYPKECSPSIYWSFLNPPLTLPNANVIHIVHIPKSWQAPHSCGSAEEGWHFSKRTNKGNEGMRSEEIKNSFLSFYEKRLKLELLRSELITINENSLTGYISDPVNISTHYSLVTFDKNIIESIIADTYSITSSFPSLLECLSRLRGQIRVANNRIKLFFNQVALPLTNKESMIKEHNIAIKNTCEKINEYSLKAIVELNKIINNA